MRKSTAGFNLGYVVAIRARIGEDVVAGERGGAVLVRVSEFV